MSITVTSGIFIGILSGHFIVNVKSSVSRCAKSLFQVAKRTGKLVKGGVPDVIAVSKVVLNDFQRGRLPYYYLPPGCPPTSKSAANADAESNADAETNEATEVVAAASGRFRVSESESCDGNAEKDDKVAPEKVNEKKRARESDGEEESPEKKKVEVEKSESPSKAKRGKKRKVK